MEPSRPGPRGPMVITTGGRHYPLREPLRGALSESGLTFNDAANGGYFFGFAALTENLREGRRQPAGEVYDLSKAAVFTEIIVKRVIIDEDAKIAKGIEMIDGRVFSATKEVVICCGCIKNPQLLGLSGIGPSSHLASHGIRTQPSIYRLAMISTIISPEHCTGN